MKIHQSWLGAALSLLYAAAAAYVVRDELRNTGGGWINLRGMGTVLVTAPSQVTFGVALEWLGVPRIDYSQPGLSGYGQLALHVAVSGERGRRLPAGVRRRVGGAALAAAAGMKLSGGRGASLGRLVRGLSG